MSFDIIIPSRYASTRLPGKPLVDLAGKTLVERVYLAAKNSKADRVIIATDDERIENEVTRFGGEVCMTESTHLSGTDRLAEVVAKVGLADDRVVVNVQGDEPFIDPDLINQVADVLVQDSTLNMSTACHSLPFNTPEDVARVQDPNLVKVVFNQVSEALYFSRSPIPFPREAGSKKGDFNESGSDHQYFQHMGIYGYRASFISLFSAMPASSLEQSESLEQLRVLQAGHRIKLIQYSGEPAIGIDTPADVERAIERLQSV